MSGITMAYFAYRSLGIGYTGGSVNLLLSASLRRCPPVSIQGTISVKTVRTKIEIFYWAAITFSQTLGTALGDWMADTTVSGNLAAALVFAAGLAVSGGVLLFDQCLPRVFILGGFHPYRPLGLPSAIY